MFDTTSNHTDFIPSSTPRATVPFPAPTPKKVGPVLKRSQSARQALAAIHLGMETCRISLLVWRDGQPFILLAHRFDTPSYRIDDCWKWSLADMERELEAGLRACSRMAPEGICSLAIEGWTADYVRIGVDGTAVENPACSWDERTLKAQASLYRYCNSELLWKLTGVHRLRMNTIYQLFADEKSGIHEEHPWLNIPEYFLSHLGGARIAEYTNATHTQLVDQTYRRWSREIFRSTEIDLACAPKIVPPGTSIGKLSGPLTALPEFAETALIAPACSETASAIAGIASARNDWAYIDLGVWARVGMLLDQPCFNSAVSNAGFGNFAAVGDRICFEKFANCMWIVTQCIESWGAQGTEWTIAELMEHASRMPRPRKLLQVDDPDLLLPGKMPERINNQRRKAALRPLSEAPKDAPAMACLIFHSLSAHYARIINRASLHSGKQVSCVYLVGDASEHRFFKLLLERATGRTVISKGAHMSTIGNFAVQLATLEGKRESRTGVLREYVSRWAQRLESAHSVAFPDAPHEDRQRLAWSESGLGGCTGNGAFVAKVLTFATMSDNGASVLPEASRHNQNWCLPERPFTAGRVEDRHLAVVLTGW